MEKRRATADGAANTADGPLPAEQAASQAKTRHLCTGGASLSEIGRPLRLAQRTCTHDKTHHPLDRRQTSPGAAHPAVVPRAHLLRRAFCGAAALFFSKAPAKV